MLEYDELPSGSDVRREYAPGGAVTITAPAGEPSAAARRAVAQRTGLSSAAFCAVALAAALWVGFGLFPSFARLDAALRAAAIVLFAVVCAGVFLLVWKVQYGTGVDLLIELCAESVILHADAHRLLVETAGPQGSHSFDLAAGEIVRVAVVSGRRSAQGVPCLTIDRAGGAALRILPGRHPAELQWVAATLRHALESRRP